MSFVNCFDVVQMVTDEASAQFAPLFCENKEAKTILHQYFDAIDVLAREFDGVTFEASVHDESMEVSVTFECPDIVIRTKSIASMTSWSVPMPSVSHTVRGTRWRSRLCSRASGTAPSDGETL